LQFEQLCSIFKFYWQYASDGQWTFCGRSAGVLPEAELRLHFVKAN